jgi:hypothetical protein
MLSPSLQSRAMFGRQEGAVNNVEAGGASGTGELP